MQSHPHCSTASRRKAGGIPAISWFGKGFDEDDLELDKLPSRRDRKYSHDKLIHTPPGLMEIESVVYDKNMDIPHAPE